MRFLFDKFALPGSVADLRSFRSKRFSQILIGSLLTVFGAGAVGASVARADLDGALYLGYPEGSARVALELAERPESLAPKKGDIYATKEMGYGFGEDTRVVSHGRLIHYMTPAEREAVRVVIYRGTVYTSDGQRFPDRGPKDNYNYVMDAAGNFYIFNQTGHEDIRHSSVFSAGPVAAAGELEIRGGTVTRINRSSGHYGPTPAMLENAIRELHKDGVGEIGDLPKFGGDHSRRRR